MNDYKLNSPYMKPPSLLTFAEKGLFGCMPEMYLFGICGNITFILYY
jgi:hypothetical protein